MIRKRRHVATRFAIQVIPNRFPIGKFCGFQSRQRRTLMIVEQPPAMARPEGFEPSAS